MPTIDETAMNTDLLICADEENKHKYHSRKLTCKLRGQFNKDNSWIFYKEYNEKAITDEEKYAN